MGLGNGVYLSTFFHQESLWLTWFLDQFLYKFLSLEVYRPLWVMKTLNPKFGVRQEPMV